MKKSFHFFREDRPGEAWLTRYRGGRDEATAWYTGQGRSTLPEASDCRAAIAAHMPELAGEYDRVCTMVGGDEIDRCILSHYRPEPVPHSCSVAVWVGQEGPALVRNYDFPLHIVSDGFELTNWNGRKVIAKTQRPWGGCLDGMNEDGLAAALTFGGAPDTGLGFSVILILRYVLETCASVEQAVKTISDIPIAMSHNVTVLDAQGDYATLFLAPNRTPVVTANRVSVNHQENAKSAGGSAERFESISDVLSAPDCSLDRLVGRFLEAPVHARAAISPTVYMAVYHPMAREVEYRWPGKVIRQSFDDFVPSRYEHHYDFME